MRFDPQMITGTEFRVCPFFKVGSETWGRARAFNQPLSSKRAQIMYVL